MDSEDDIKAGLELQKVLTRYVDSHDGYAHAADLVTDKALAEVFMEISGSRAAIIPRVARMIESEGYPAEIVGSVEGTVHRGWMSLRDKISDDGLGDLLRECIRGESALLDSIDEAIESGNLNEEDSKVIQMVRIDVEKAISHFNAAVNNGEFS